MGVCTAVSASIAHGDKPVASGKTGAVLPVVNPVWAKKF